MTFGSSVPERFSRNASAEFPDRGLRPYVALFAAVSVLYGKSLFYGFIPTWDDSLYVTENPFIRGLTFENVRGIFTTPVLSNYAPFHILSYLVDYMLWGLNPAGYHFTNVVLHGLNVCALYALLEKLEETPAVSFFAALVFAVHPLNVENAAWISERKSLLSTFLFLISFRWYMSFRKSGSGFKYAVSAVFYACSLLVKASVVVLPALLASYEIFLVRKRRWKPLALFFILALSGSAVEIASHVLGGSVGGDILSREFLFGAVYPTMLPIYLKYLLLAFFPLNLSGYYDTSHYRSFFEPVVLASVLSLLFMFAAVFAAGRARTKFWFLWFWICLFPVSNIIPIPVYYADRYLYLPGMGLFVICASAVALVAEEKLRLKRIFLFFSAAAVMMLASLTFVRLDVWRDELTFWTDTAAKSPGQYKARLNLALSYEKHDRLQDALRECTAAVSIYADSEAASVLERIKTKIRLNAELGIKR